jgi:hypothetical protein
LAVRAKLLHEGASARIFFKGQNNVEWLLRQPLSRLKSSEILCLTGGRGKFEILQFQFKYFDVNEIRSFIFLRIITDVEV